MRAILFVLFAGFSLVACINPSQPPKETPPVVQQEPLGSPDTEQQGKSFAITTEAFYQASVNSNTSPGRVISLSLTPEHKAKMTTDHLDNQPAVVDTGGWTTLENGNLQLNLRRKGEKDSVLLEFKPDGEKLVYSGTEYGAGGLVLWVKPVPK